MTFLILTLLAVTAGTAAGFITWRYPSRHGASAVPSLDAAQKVGEEIRAHGRHRTALRRRFDPESLTGLALSLALLFTIGAGVVLGLLAYLVRTNSHLVGIDNGVAKWGNRHASVWSTHLLNGVTELGQIYVVIALAVVLVAVELRRRYSHWLLPFVVAVLGGEEIFSTAIKEIVDRARPTFNPAAATLGPSFPSGHSATSAAFYAAAALILGRGRPRGTRALLNGAAVGIAVGVAASRVFLDVHWLTDVIGGLALGWAWFAICGMAFGGRLLVFGAGAEVAEEAADAGRAPFESPPPALPRIADRRR
jgi:membrane-associated phospholipid phosphatase